MNDVNHYMHAAGYESLADVLKAAFDQAASGKGAERHANGRPFGEQPMQVISDLLGTDAGMAFQAIKKLIEGRGFPEIERREREMLGAINYIAGMVIYGRRHHAAGAGDIDWRLIATRDPDMSPCVELPVRVTTTGQKLASMTEYDVAAMDDRAKQALISMGWTPPSEGPVDLGEFVPPKARAMQAAVECFAEAALCPTTDGEKRGEAVRPRLMPGIPVPDIQPGKTKYRDMPLILPTCPRNAMPEWVPEDADYYSPVTRFAFRIDHISATIKKAASTPWTRSPDPVWSGANTLEPLTRQMERLYAIHPDLVRVGPATTREAATPPAPPYPLGFDPFMPPDEVWLQHPQLCFSTVDADGTVKLWRTWPNPPIQMDKGYWAGGAQPAWGWTARCTQDLHLWRSSLRRRPEHLSGKQS